MTCITIYSPVLRAPQEGYNELQRVTMGYKPLWGKQPDHQHVSDFPRVADVSAVLGVRIGSSNFKPEHLGNVRKIRRPKV